MYLFDINTAEVRVTPTNTLNQSIAASVCMAMLWHGAHVLVLAGQQEAGARQKLPPIDSHKPVSPLRSNR